MTDRVTWVSERRRISVEYLGPPGGHLARAARAGGYVYLTVDVVGEDERGAAS